MTDPQDANEQLLRDALKACETEDWNQSQWRCGSARCFIGWASYLAGGRFVSSESDCTVLMIDGRREFRSSIIRTPSNELMHVADHATRELCISDEDTVAIADERNTLEKLRVLVDNLITYGSTSDPADCGYDIDPAADGGPDPDHEYDIHADAEFAL